MNHYTLQPQSSSAQAESSEIAETVETLPAAAPDNSLRRAPVQTNSDLILRTLATLQRQQSEQTHLLRQLLQEIETLKAAQSQQGTTVSKLDRSLRRARLLRISWLVARLLFFGAGIGFIVYIIGVEQIQSMWERLLWLLT
ncbi:MAG: hypothetical protein R2932_05185 [Caldilineaceae bacterium]